MARRITSLENEVGGSDSAYVKDLTDQLAMKDRDLLDLSEAIEELEEENRKSVRSLSELSVEAMGKPVLRMVVLTIVV
eukprot:2448443-Rhodomonas_salina.2